MLSTLLILKIASLYVTIHWGIVVFGKIIRGHAANVATIGTFALGLTGLITLSFWVPV